MTINEGMVKGDSYHYLTYTGNFRRIKVGFEYEFECICGIKKYWKNISYLRSGRIKSCGCKRFKCKHDLSEGVRYGYLTLTGSCEMRRENNRLVKYVEANCACGVIRFFKSCSLTSGYTKSCGCRTNEMISNSSTIHGLGRDGVNRHPLYGVYYKMISRCYNNKDTSYRYYGGRGVKVCDEWLNDFISFFKWCISNGWERGLSIDKDKKAKEMGVENIMYSPEMCIITDTPTQNRYKKDNIFLSAFGETKCLRDWSLDVRCKIGYRALCNRVKKIKMDAEFLITSPALKSGRKKKIK